MYWGAKLLIEKTKKLNYKVKPKALLTFGFSKLYKLLNGINNFAFKGVHRNILRFLEIHLFSVINLKIYVSKKKIFTADSTTPY